MATRSSARVTVLAGSGAWRTSRVAPSGSGSAVVVAACRVWMPAVGASCTHA